MLSNPHLFDLNNSRLASIDRVGNAGAWLETAATTTYAVTKYYSLAGQRVAMRQGTTVNYLYGDHLGSTSLISDAAGSTISEARYPLRGQASPTVASTGSGARRRRTSAIPASAWTALV